MKTHFSISSRLSAVYRGFSALTSETSCSSYFMKTSPAKTQFQMCPFSANTRSDQSRTSPDRSATPYYVESFQFQPGSIEWKLKISKVCSKTLPGSQFSGLTAGDVNNALLISWKWTFAWQWPEMVPKARVLHEAVWKKSEKHRARTPERFSRDVFLIFSASHHAKHLLLRRFWDGRGPKLVS